MVKLQIVYTDSTIKQLMKGASTSGSAGIDLYISLDRDVVLLPGERVMFSCGFKVAIPKNHFGLLLPRSSSGLRGITLQNTAGVIDSDYRGEVRLAVVNSHHSNIRILKYEKLAQMLIIPYLNTQLFTVDELDCTERGEGGFGSTA